ncbi:MAG: AAA family ATPase [Saprospiraceae bacterium]|nr:AAA family ATPase [Saprospiraceae bacterium]
MELRRIKANRVFSERDKNQGENKEKFKKAKKKYEKALETEEDEQTSSAALLKKKQEMRAELEAELADKMEQLIEVEDLKRLIQESEKYSLAWFKALLRLEYILAYEKQEKDRSFQVYFDKIEREAGTNKTLLLKRPSQIFPYNIEEAGDITLKLQLANERRNLAVEVVSIKDTGLRAKLKTPEEIADIDFSKIRGATLEIQNHIFVLEELTKAFDELPYPDVHNIQTNLLKDIRFIFGPPGTGKTTYLAHEEIQPAMLSDEPLKVLVLTPTNKAADVLVQKCKKYAVILPNG